METIGRVYGLKVGLRLLGAFLETAGSVGGCDNQGVWGLALETPTSALGAPPARMMLRAGMY